MTNIDYFMFFVGKIYSLKSSGVLNRPCKMTSSQGTYWPTINVCNCTDVRPDPFKSMVTQVYLY